MIPIIKKLNPNIKIYKDQESLKYKYLVYQTSAIYDGTLKDFNTHTQAIVYLALNRPSKKSTINGFIRKYYKTFETLSHVFSDRKESTPMTYSDIFKGTHQHYQLLNLNKSVSFYLDIDKTNHDKILSILKIVSKKISPLYVLENDLQDSCHIFGDRMFKNGQDLKDFVQALNLKKYGVDTTVYKSEQLFRLPYAEKEDLSRGIFNRFYIYNRTLKPIQGNYTNIKHFIIKN